MSNVEEIPIPPPIFLNKKLVKKKLTPELNVNLKNVVLRKVAENEKHYVTLAEFTKKMEDNFRKETFGSYRNEEYEKEFFDSNEVLNEKIEKFCKLVKNSKKIVFFTGAGISTSAGIPDFRGPSGEWTLASQGKRRTKKVTSFINAFPTLTHMSIVTLLKKNKVKQLISQNCDGLHLKSGVPRSKISELHGNCNIEICEDCEKEYYRDFYCRRKVLGKDHFTGRFCQSCGGRLMNSTIDFDQSLPIKTLKRAWSEVENCDLMVVLGSSLLVSPASKMPEMILRRGKPVVIINIQKTPLHKNATLNIHGKCDYVMQNLMEKLGFNILNWKIPRKVQLNFSKNKKMLKIRSLLLNDEKICSTIIKDVRIDYSNVVMKKSAKKDQPSLCFEFKIDEDVKDFKVSLNWFGNYGEEEVSFVHKGKKKKIYSFLFNPYCKEWKLLN